jgi:pimeloyl-ACP methyl ester carboxylesterase
VKETTRRWLRRVLLGLGLLYIVLVFGVLPYWLAWFVTKRRFEFPDLRNAGLTPATFDLPFEDVTFNAPDGVTLDGWWVPSPASQGTVVLLHGLNRSRIEMVGKVPFLNRLGWNVLLFDLRHHGKSGGRASTFGFLEKGDVAAAVELARRRAPSRPVVLWGVSLGAASAALAAAEDPTIAGLVCDSSYRSLRDTVRHHVRLFRGVRWWTRLVPPWPVDEALLFWIGRHGGFDPAAVDVRSAAARLSGRPALFVCNSGDRRMPQEIAFELKAAAGERARVLVVPGDSHGGAYREGTAAYESQVSEVLREALAGPPASRTSAVVERSRP